MKTNTKTGGADSTSRFSGSVQITKTILDLSYSEFKEWVHKNEKNLSKDDRLWLNRWDSWDMACSPMDDSERRQIRYGHFLCWFDGRDEQNNGESRAKTGER